MKKLFCILIVLLALTAVGIAESPTFTYRFADADEGAALLLSNRDYYEHLSQNDLNYRMQKLDATLEELEAYTATQVLSLSDEEKAAIDAAMARIEAICAERGYALPATDGIVFVKTTMAEECNAGAYTHGTQIYLGELLMGYALSDNPAERQYFQRIMIHELFHCLTRNHPDFRADMYGLLGFTVVDEDYPFPQAIWDVVISNPDVEHHNSYATFDIDGRSVNCTVVFTTAPFEKPGDSFFTNKVTGLVPIDDLSTMHTSEDASNFWDVFGRNTDYVIDPEETLADNFSYTVLYGPDDEMYETPELINAIDAYLKGLAAMQDAA